MQPHAAKVPGQARDHASRKSSATFAVGDRVHVWSNSTRRWIEDGVVREALPADLSTDGSHLLPAGSLRVVFGGGVRMKWVTPQELGATLRRAPGPSRPDLRAVPTPQRAAAERPERNQAGAEMLAELVAVETRCQQEGRQFVDADFAPVVLGGNVKEWVRPQELSFHSGEVLGGLAGELALLTSAVGLPNLVSPAVDWQLFRGAPTADDVQQGEVGDCWFLSSLAALAEFQGGVFVRSLLPGQESISASGVYMVRLCLGGRWHWTLVDDRLPSLGGSFNHRILAHCETQRLQLWASLIEKAAAKACGSYEGLHLGEAREALSMLTGWPCKTIGFSRRDFSPDILWATLSSSKKAGFLVACGTFAVRTSSLIPHHIYSVLDVFDLDAPGQDGRRARLVKIRNPQLRDTSSAAKKWNGAWLAPRPSVDSRAAEQGWVPGGRHAGRLLHGVRRFHPAVRALHHVCRIQSADWHEARETLELPGRQPPELAISIEVADAAECSLSLSQPEERLRGSRLHKHLSKHMARIGFAVLRLLPDGEVEAVAASHLRGDPLVSTDCRLQPGKYLLVAAALHRETVPVPVGFACFSSRPVALGLQSAAGGAWGATRRALRLQQGALRAPVPVPAFGLAEPRGRPARPPQHGAACGCAQQ
ncbi:unnamed protein product [Prorocentrum cordatum]|uniref:Calpain catalytic domain-containing protein n=1 Tax=Prorocentrum cordatum TaxID=2364126 RepID=A0ABN9RFL7_9DINO|nr:unnamed protein product [Polarella glacialis]